MKKWKTIPFLVSGMCGLLLGLSSCKEEKMAPIEHSEFARVKEIYLNKYEITLDQEKNSDTLIATTVGRDAIMWEAFDVLGSNVVEISSMMGDINIVRAKNMGLAYVIAYSMVNGNLVSDTCAVTVAIPGILLYPPLLFLTNGDAEQLDVWVYPEETKVTWNCLNNENGQINFVIDEKKNQAYISPQMDNINKIDSVKIEVSASIGGDIKSDTCFVYIANFSLYTHQLTLEKNKTQQLSTNWDDDDYLKTFVEWESEDPSVATVDNTGNVTTVSAGKTQIKAKVIWQSQEFASTCEVNVIGLSLNPSKLVVPTGKETKSQIKYEIYPQDASITTGVTWSSEEENVATVDPSGNVTIRGNIGDAIITASATIKVGENLYEIIEYCNVSVKDAFTVTIYGHDNNVLYTAEGIEPGAIIPKEAYQSARNNENIAGLANIHKVFAGWYSANKKDKWDENTPVETDLSLYSAYMGYVDLGDGIGKWADRNLGAFSKTDCGGYYILKQNDKTVIDYCKRGNDVEIPAQFRFPTYQEMCALKNRGKEKYEFVTENNRNGLKIIGSPDFIFLPMAGHLSPDGTWIPWDNSGALYPCNSFPNDKSVDIYFINNNNKKDRWMAWGGINEGFTVRLIYVGK